MNLNESQYETLTKAVFAPKVGFRDALISLDAISAVSVIDEDDEDVVLTREPLSAFDADNTWNERSGLTRFEIDGCQCVHWARVQPRRGDRRAKFTIVDFGDFRAVYEG